MKLSAIIYKPEGPGDKCHQKSCTCLRVRASVSPFRREAGGSARPAAKNASTTDSLPGARVSTAADSFIRKAPDDDEQKERRAPRIFFFFFRSHLEWLSTTLRCFHRHHTTMFSSLYGRQQRGVCMCPIHPELALIISAACFLCFQPRYFSRASSPTLYYIYMYVHAAQHRHFLQLPPPRCRTEAHTRRGQTPWKYNWVQDISNAVVPGKRGAGKATLLAGTLIAHSYVLMLPHHSEYRNSNFEK